METSTAIAIAPRSDQDETEDVSICKPYWSNYWASLQHFNMRRRNDGDSIKVNYIGHWNVS
jgi:hypothetical protein